MRLLKFGLHLTGSLAMIMGFSGCADEKPWGSTDGEKGSLSLKLTTDYGFDTAKPLFRNGEEETRAEESLDAYTSLPKADAFSIKLENTNGYSKEWESLSLFNENESIKNGLSTGLYTITAYYGEMATTGEDAPYFEAKSSFTVLPGRKSEVELNAELKNSMVYINYTDDFKSYMKEFTTSLSATGSTQIVSNTYNEQNPLPEKIKAIFIEPKEVKVNVNFTTKETGKKASVSVGSFPAVAKTLHKMTFDINHKDNGFATLTVTFDEETGSETVDVDLTEQLFAVDAPTITYTGSNDTGTEFPSGTTINILDNPTVAFSVLAPGGLNTATLTINGTGTSSFNEVIDLRNTDKTSLKAKGIVSQGFYGDNIETTNTLATLDITEYAKNLISGDYSVKLDVTDKSNRITSFQLYANTEQVVAQLAKDESNTSLTPNIPYASTQTELVLDYNGSDYQELKFKASDASGNLTEVTANYVNSEMLSTRGFENRRCHYTVTLPYSKKSHVQFAAFNKAGNQISTFEVPVTVPEYSVLVDAYSRYAYLKIVPANAADLPIIMENLQMQIDDSEAAITQDNATGEITISQLNAGTETIDEYNVKYRKGLEYTFQSSLTGEDWKETIVATEDELPIPNGDFSQERTDKNLDSGTLYVGGKFIDRGTHEVQAMSSYFHYLPAHWETINDLTTSATSNNNNTWFRVPSSWLDKDNGMVIIRSVGYHPNGITIDRSGDWKDIKYYCRNAPTNAESALERAAGELFLESNFNSRPTRISITYEYTPLNGDSGVVDIDISDSNGNSIATTESYSITQTNGFVTKEFRIQYMNSTKAGNINIKFKSSNQTDTKKIPINIPKGEDLSEGLKYSISGEYIVSQNNYHALATGSVLKIDNVTAHYATEPPSKASGVKRNSNKMTRK